MATLRHGDPILCNHANEVPMTCPCAPYCYCRVEGSCRKRHPSRFSLPVQVDYMPKYPAKKEPGEKLERAIVLALQIQEKRTEVDRLEAQLRNLFGENDGRPGELPPDTDISASVRRKSTKRLVRR